MAFRPRTELVREREGGAEGICRGGCYYLAQRLV